MKFNVVKLATKQLKQLLRTNMKFCIQRLVVQYECQIKKDESSRVQSCVQRNSLVARALAGNTAHLFICFGAVLLDILFSVSESFAIALFVALRLRLLRLPSQTQLFVSILS
jgi:hypothetical protein